jgi:hypothetical protein
MREISEQRFLTLVRGNAGDALLHRNLEFYEHEGGRAIGAVVLDLVDHDFGWVMPERHRGRRGFWVEDVVVSLPTREKARESLLARMQGGSGPSPEFAEILNNPDMLEKMRELHESGEHKQAVRNWAYRSPPGDKH